MYCKLCIIVFIGLVIFGCNKTNINSPADTMKLDLIYPNGGENIFISDNPVTIKWTSENIEKVNLYYSQGSDSSWILIADSIDAGQGSFSWDIRNMNPGSYRLKITDIQNRKSDVSNSPFFFDIMIIDLISPNGGEEFFITGIPVTIKWTSENIDKVNIYYSKDSDTSWILIADSIDAGQGSFDWNIKNMIPGTYELKITGYNDENISDLTENPFTLSYDPNIINVSRFYPLQVGNRWVYKVRYQQSIFPPPVDTIYSLERKIISDTSFESGKVYYKILETDYYKQYTKLYFERVDSTDGNVYRRYPDNQFGIVLVDSLLAKVGDQFKGHRFTLPNSSYYMYTEFLESISAGYFGIILPARKYRELDTYAFYDYFLVEDIGLGDYYQMLDIANRTANLKGCIINNVLYGDTTISY